MCPITECHEDKFPARPLIFKERLKLLAINLVVAAIIAGSLQMAIPIHRPCQLEPNNYSICVPYFAYPSIHASTSFSFVFPFLGHLLFFILYAIGLLICWSRVHEGLHSWLDIGGGIAIAGLGYGIAEMLVKKHKSKICRADERLRQTLHAFIGLLICLMIWIIGIETTSYFVLSGTCFGILLIHPKLIGIKIPVVDKLFDRFERNGVIPGEGAIYYALGVLFALGLLRSNSTAAISVVLILTLGDSLATYIGRCQGRHNLPWNSNKTVEGSMGFAAGAMFSLLVLPTPMTVLVVLTATVVESLPANLDDNITLPILSSLLYYFFYNL
jgi:dolichol kinase